VLPASWDWYLCHIWSPLMRGRFSMAADRRPREAWPQRQAGHAGRSRGQEPRSCSSPTQAPPSLRVRRRRRSSARMAAVAAGRGSGGGAHLRGGRIQRELQRRPEELRRINGDGAVHAATQSPSSLSLPAPDADEPSARGPAPRRLFP
jgi:hypothetical protein